MKTLFIDFNNLSIRNVFMEKEMINNPNPEFGLHKHALLQSILMNIKKFSPDEVILAIDDENCWRKKIYPEYKAHRKDKRDKDIFPWDMYYSYIREYTEEIKLNFPFKFLKVPYAEADDVIAVLTKYLAGEKVVVTVDSDYIQLLDIPNVKLYNPLKEKFTKDDTPSRTLMIKILSGDPGDNIPNIKPRLGPKTAEKLILENKVDEFLLENNLQDVYTRNCKLIDWNHIPQILKQRIVELYNNYKVDVTCCNNLFNFFVKHRLRNQLENMNITKEILKPLINRYKEDEFKNFCNNSGSESLYE